MKSNLTLLTVLIHVTGSWIKVLWTQQHVDFKDNITRHFFTEKIDANLNLLADTNDPRMFYVLKYGN